MESSPPSLVLVLCQHFARSIISRSIWVSPLPPVHPWPARSGGVPEVPIQCNFCLISGLPGLDSPPLLPLPRTQTSCHHTARRPVHWSLSEIFSVSSDQGNISTGKHFPGESLSDIQCRGTPWPHCLKLRVSPNSAVMTTQKLARPSYRVTR